MGAGQNWATQNGAYLSLSDIHPYARNPRKNDEAVKNVAASIREFGFLVSLVIDRNHKIVAGHTRYMFTANVRELNVITGGIRQVTAPFERQSSRHTLLFEGYTMMIMADVPAQESIPAPSLQ